MLGFEKKKHNLRIQNVEMAYSGVLDLNDLDQKLAAI
jgi:hypothetical protein